MLAQRGSGPSSGEISFPTPGRREEVARAARWQRDLDAVREKVARERRRRVLNDAVPLEGGQRARVQSYLGDWERVLKEVRAEPEPPGSGARHPTTTGEEDMEDDVEDDDERLPDLGEDGKGGRGWKERQATAELLEDSKGRDFRNLAQSMVRELGKSVEQAMAIGGAWHIVSDIETLVAGLMPNGRAARDSTVTRPLRTQTENDSRGPPQYFRSMNSVVTKMLMQLTRLVFLDVRTEWVRASLPVPNGEPPGLPMTLHRVLSRVVHLRPVSATDPTARALEPGDPGDLMVFENLASLLMGLERLVPDLGALHLQFPRSVTRLAGGLKEDGHIPAPWWLFPRANVHCFHIRGSNGPFDPVRDLKPVPLHSGGVSPLCEPLPGPANPMLWQQLVQHGLGFEDVLPLQGLHGISDAEQRLLTTFCLWRAWSVYTLLLQDCWWPLGDEAPREHPMIRTLPRSARRTPHARAAWEREILTLRKWARVARLGLERTPAGLMAWLRLWHALVDRYLLSEFVTEVGGGTATVQALRTHATAALLATDGRSGQNSAGWTAGGTHAGHDATGAPGGGTGGGGGPASRRRARGRRRRGGASGPQRGAGHGRGDHGSVGPANLLHHGGSARGVRYLESIAPLLPGELRMSPWKSASALAQSLEEARGGGKRVMHSGSLPGPRTVCAHLLQQGSHEGGAYSHRQRLKNAQEAAGLRVALLVVLQTKLRRAPHSNSGSIQGAKDMALGASHAYLLRKPLGQLALDIPPGGVPLDEPAGARRRRERAWVATAHARVARFLVLLRLVLPGFPALKTTALAVWHRAPHALMRLHMVLWVLLQRHYHEVYGRGYNYLPRVPSSSATDLHVQDNSGRLSMVPPVRVGWAMLELVEDALYRLGQLYTMMTASAAHVRDLWPSAVGVPMVSSPTRPDGWDNEDNEVEQPPLGVQQQQPPRGKKKKSEAADEADGSAGRRKRKKAGPRRPAGQGGGEGERETDAEEDESLSQTFRNSLEVLRPLGDPSLGAPPVDTNPASLEDDEDEDEGILVPATTATVAAPYPLNPWEYENGTPGEQDAEAEALRTEIERRDGAPPPTAEAVQEVFDTWHQTLREGARRCVAGRENVRRPPRTQPYSESSGTTRRMHAEKQRQVLLAAAEAIVGAARKDFLDNWSSLTLTDLLREQHPTSAWRMVSFRVLQLQAVLRRPGRALSEWPWRASREASFWPLQRRDLLALEGLGSAGKERRSRVVAEAGAHLAAAEGVDVSGLEPSSEWVMVVAHRPTEDRLYLQIVRSHPVRFSRRRLFCALVPGGEGMPSAPSLKLLQSRLGRHLWCFLDPDADREVQRLSAARGPNDLDLHAGAGTMYIPPQLLNRMHNGWIWVLSHVSDDVETSSVCRVPVPPLEWGLAFFGYVRSAAVTEEPMRDPSSLGELLAREQEMARRRVRFGIQLSPPGMDLAQSPPAEDEGDAEIPETLLARWKPSPGGMEFEPLWRKLFSNLEQRARDRWSSMVTLWGWVRGRATHLTPTQRSLWDRRAAAARMWARWAVLRAVLGGVVRMGPPGVAPPWAYPVGGEAGAAAQEPLLPTPLVGLRGFWGWPGNALYLGGGATTPLLRLPFLRPLAPDGATELSMTSVAEEQARPILARYPPQVRRKLVETLLRKVFEASTGTALSQNNFLRWVSMQNRINTVLIVGHRDQ